MLLVSKSGFIEVVAHQSDESRLIVRSRDRASLESLAVLTRESIIAGAEAALPYILVCGRSHFGEWLRLQAAELSYGSMGAIIGESVLASHDAAESLVAVLSVDPPPSLNAQPSLRVVRRNTGVSETFTAEVEPEQLFAALLNQLHDESIGREVLRWEQRGDGHSWSGPWVIETLEADRSVVIYDVSAMGARLSATERLKQRIAQSAVANESDTLSHLLLSAFYEIANDVDLLRPEHAGFDVDVEYTVIGPWAPKLEPWYLSEAEPSPQFLITLEWRMMVASVDVTAQLAVADFLFTHVLPLSAHRDINLKCVAPLEGTVDQPSVLNGAIAKIAAQGVTISGPDEFDEVEDDQIEVIVSLDVDLVLVAVDEEATDADGPSERRVSVPLTRLQVEALVKRLSAGVEPDQAMVDVVGTSRLSAIEN